MEKNEKQQEDAPACLEKQGWKKSTYCGYIARDEMGSLHLFLHDRPWKGESEVGQGEWTNDSWDGVTIRPTDFDLVQWNDKEATPVKIVITLNNELKR